jgi:Interleukin-like EMT inducer
VTGSSARRASIQAVWGRGEERRPPGRRGKLSPPAPASPSGSPPALRHPGLGWRGGALVYGTMLVGVGIVTWPLARHPASLWPPHHDPRVFTWVMASLARRLFNHPLTLFHGNAFYPNGESLAYTEPLLVPTLIGLPGFLWGNPILTYNLLLLFLWPLNGLAMACVAHALTGSRPAAFLAGTVFCLSPYFTEYYLEFQMLLAWLIPIVLFAWIRWLESGARRWLALACGGLAAQGITTWYYTIILGLALVTVAVAFLCLRWRGWTWGPHLLSLGLGALAVGVVLWPVALPYFRVHREFAYYRSVKETGDHYADVFSFFGGGRRTVMDRYVPRITSAFYPETSAFAGVATLGLAAVSLVHLRRDGRGPASAARAGRIAVGGLAGSLLFAAWSLASGPGWMGMGPLGLRVGAEMFLELAVVLGLVLLLLRGWIALRERGSRLLTAGDWVRCLLFVIGVFALLALGPVIHVGGRDVGSGPYRAVYDLLFPLRVIRVTTRFAVVSLAGLALLAALGVRVIQDRLAGRPGLRRTFVAVVFLALGFDYAVAPAQYEPVSAAPRAVDRVLQADPDDVAVLEWPTNSRRVDADAMVRSLHHGKRLVNGLSGFVPPLIGELWNLWSRPTEPFPAPEAQAVLRRIYPLRHLVVRLSDPGIPPEWRLTWHALRQAPPPVLQFVGSFGDDDLYRVVPLPEYGRRFERTVSYELLRTRPILRLALRPRPPRTDLDQHVEIQVNRRPVERVGINQETTARLALPPPYFRAAPNAVTLVHGYRRPPSALDAAYRIGTTGVLCPGDLALAGASFDLAKRERAASVRFNGVELAPDQRGYNLVALDSTGRLVAAAAFDTFARRTANAELAAWVAALPPGTVVAATVRDEASQSLDERAVQALRTLGVAGDLRGRVRQVHVLVGVKGAPLGSALERLGRPAASLLVGRPDPERGVELTGFDLIRPDDRG